MKTLTPHQLVVLGLELEELIEDAASGFDLDTILPDERGGYWILSAQRVPAPRGPPNQQASNDQWTLQPPAPRKPMTKSIFATSAASPDRRGPLPLKDRHGPRLSRDESLGRYAYWAGQIVDEAALRTPVRREMLRLIGRIWCAGEELEPSEVRRVLSDVLKVRKLVPKLGLGQHKKMQLYGHLKALIQDLQGRLQLKLFP